MENSIGEDQEWKKDENELTANDSVSLPSGGEQTPPLRRDDRPLSRRGMISRQSQSMEERPFTQQSGGRPITSGRSSGLRTPSATTASRGSLVPGTASRLATAMRQSPVSRLGTAINFAGAPLNVVDRPITQQGLSGLKTGIRGPQMRQVQDKRYYEGYLQTKIRDLGNEVARLGKEIENHQKEQATFLIYDKRVKEMAAELTELQGSLADYNLVVDKMNTETEKSEIDAECHELRARNKQETANLEQLFIHTKQKEAQVQQLEMEIEQERHMADNLLQAMSPSLRSRYADLQQKNIELQKDMERLQSKLDSLNARKNGLEDQLAVSQTKQEAVRLHHKLLEAEERRATLLEEEKNRATPAQEREQLLQRVKDDNAEIATMERQIGEMKDVINKKQEELEQIEQDLEESQSERHQKYRELRRREETMEQFLATFEETKAQETERISQLEADIVTALQQISKNLALSGNLPSADEFSAIKDNLVFKEGELEKSKKTVEGLTKEHQQLRATHNKLEALEGKIKLEMDTLKQKIATMTEDMVRLSDLDSLKRDAEEKRTALEKERDFLEEKKGPLLIAVKEIESEYNALKKQLDENETYAQLSNLERKMAQIEQTNFAIKEYIASKRCETDYEPLKTKVFELVDEYNNCLRESLK